MLRHIEELRKKPKAVRNQYAFTIALSVTLLIVAVWAISLPARLAFEDLPETQTETVDGGQSFGEQLSNINNFFGEGMEEIKTQAEIIGAIETEGNIEEPAAIEEPVIDTAHYDFFPAAVESRDSNAP